MSNSNSNSDSMSNYKNYITEIRKQIRRANFTKLQNISNTNKWKNAPLGVKRKIFRGKLKNIIHDIIVKGLLNIRNNDNRILKLKNLHNSNLINNKDIEEVKKRVNKRLQELKEKQNILNKRQLEAYKSKTLLELNRNIKKGNMTNFRRKRHIENLITKIKNANTIYEINIFLKRQQNREQFHKGRSLYQVINNKKRATPGYVGSNYENRKRLKELFSSLNLANNWNNLENAENTFWSHYGYWKS